MSTVAASKMMAASSTAAIRRSIERCANSIKRLLTICVFRIAYSVDDVLITWYDWGWQSLLYRTTSPYQGQLLLHNYRQEHIQQRILVQVRFAGVGRGQIGEAG